MRSPRGLLLVAATLVAAGCDGLLGEGTDEVSGVDRRVAERVLEHVLDRLDRGYAERGPLAAFDLPDYKLLAAKTEDFESWAAFKKRLQKTDPSLEVEFSRRITERLRELLERSRAAAAQGD